MGKTINFQEDMKTQIPPLHADTTIPDNYRLTQNLVHSLLYIKVKI